MNQQAIYENMTKGERVTIACFKDGKKIGYWNGERYAILLDTIELFKDAKELEYEFERAKIAVPHKYEKDIEVRVIPVDACINETIGKGINPESVEKMKEALGKILAATEGDQIERRSPSFINWLAKEALTSAKL
jgi:hypothetical protein